MNKCGTLRFEVFLDSKSSENYEISFLDLIRNNKSDSKNLHDNEEVEEFEKFVKALDEKYGPVAVIKGKRIRVNDFVDQGNGYDVDDPFIDDSEGDEALVVAPDLMTEHGGFFINSKNLKLNEDNFVIERVEGDTTNSLMQHAAKKPIIPKSKSQQLISQARKRLTTPFKNKSLKRILQHSGKKIEIINNTSNCDYLSDVNEQIDTEPEVPFKKAKKAHVEKNEFNDLLQKEGTNAVNIIDLDLLPVKVFELPKNLPEDILEKVNSLQSIFEQCKPNIKLSSHFSSVLYELDSLLLANSKIMKNIRSNVLRHLAQKVNMKYDAILRRINKIKDNNKKQKLQSLISTLEEAIKEAMIDSVGKYDSAMIQYTIKIEAQKASKIMSTSESIDSSSKKLLESDVDSKIKIANKVKAPKRSFKWTLLCKSLLFKVIFEELDSFKTLNNKEILEEHLSKFYLANIIPVFQPKWMTVSELMKISVPIIHEFKQCLLNGKEFTTYSPVIKQKTKAKEINQDETKVSPAKDQSIIKNNIKLEKLEKKIKSTIDFTNNETGLSKSNLQNNVVCSKTKKSKDKGAVVHTISKDINTNDEKIVISLNNTSQSSQVTTNLSKQIVRTSSSHPSSTLDHNVFKFIEESRKRYSNGSLIINSAAERNENNLYNFKLGTSTCQKEDYGLLNQMNCLPRYQQSVHHRSNIDDFVLPKPEIISKMSSQFHSNIVKQNYESFINKPRRSIVPMIQPFNSQVMRTSTLYHSQEMINSDPNIYQMNNYFNSPVTNYDPRNYDKSAFIDLATENVSKSERDQLSSNVCVDVNIPYGTGNGDNK